MKLILLEKKASLYLFYNYYIAYIYMGINICSSVERVFTIQKTLKIMKTI